MPTITERNGDMSEEKRPLGRRLLWFAALWIGSLAAVAAAAYLLRALLFLG